MRMDRRRSVINSTGFRRRASDDVATDLRVIDFFFSDDRHPPLLTDVVPHVDIQL